MGAVVAGDEEGREPHRARTLLDGRSIETPRRAPTMDRDMDASAIRAAAAASSATYRSFADATRSVLDLLEHHMPTAVLYLAHLDRGQFIHRIVDARNGQPIGLRSNLAIPMGDAFCSHMAEDRGPRLCNDVPADDVYGDLPMQRRVVAGS